MNVIYDLLCEILTKLTGIQARVARTETRLMKLAEAMNVSVRKQK